MKKILISLLLILSLGTCRVDKNLQARRTLFILVSITQVNRTTRHAFILTWVSQDGKIKVNEFVPEVDNKYIGMEITVFLLR